MARAYSHVFHIPLIIKNCKQKVNRHMFLIIIHLFFLQGEVPRAKKPILMHRDRISSSKFFIDFNERFISSVSPLYEFL